MTLSVTMSIPTLSLKTWFHLAGNMLSGFTIDKHTYEWYDGESYDGQSIVYIQDYSYNEIRNDMLKALGQLDETTSENQGDYYGYKYKLLMK